MTAEVRLFSGDDDMEIIAGLGEKEEIEVMGRMMYRERYKPTLDWLLTMRAWLWRADLTFACMASPERAEKAVALWLRRYAQGSWAIVGYERQDRGAVHAHVVLDLLPDPIDAKVFWERSNGFARIAKIHSAARSIAYAVKHAMKQGDFDVYGPGIERAIYSTGEQHILGLPA